MKKVYWLLLLFGLWCAACGTWYMTVMKGIRSDPHFFEPHISTVAIVEILLMLLVACLLGYAIGWSLREDPIQALKDNVEQLEADRAAILKLGTEKDELLTASQQQLSHLQQTFTLKANNAKREADSLRRELSDMEQELARAKEISTSAVEHQQLENEAGTLRYRIKQLEFQNLELEESQTKLRQELQENLAKQTKRSPEPIHPFVRPVEMSERDDLTKIKGIGPFIEKRLNMVGIYTYHQISELTPEIIEHVTKAIEFFPNRINRDNWVGQATKLL